MIAPSGTHSDTIMKSPLWSASCLMVILVSIADVTLAQNKFCINADNIINKLYVNGNDVSPKLSYEAVVKKCDCINLPFNTITIAVRASNLRGEAGLQTCRSLHQAVYRDWQCISAKRIVGKKWFGLKYKTSPPWKPARKYKYPGKSSCMVRQKKSPCRPRNPDEWFWAVKQIPSVACRIDYCSLSCSGCQAVGAGRCDPDKCTHGPGTDAGTVVLDDKGFVTCQRKCCIDIKATTKTETPNGYVRVTDGETGVVDSWELKQAGRYLATIDVEACTTTRRNYTDWDNAPLRTGDTLNVWKSSSLSPELSRIFGIDVVIGNGNGSYAPWIDIWECLIGLFVLLHYRVEMFGIAFLIGW